MTSEELLQKVRKIEIKTHGLSRNIFAGEYHSQFKGRGMAFSEVREYQPGDDVRSIDWNVTARMNRPYIKVYEEERELTVMLLVDVSGSRNFGSVSQMKRDTMAEVAATLAFSTIENNDKVGVIFFSDQIEKFIPPKKGKSHVLHIIRELLSFEPQHTGTDINAALQFLTNAQKRRCTAFLISDFIGAYPQPLPKGKGVIKCQIYSEGQGDTYIGEEGDTHGDAYILYAAQHSGTDALQSVGKLEERA